MLCSPFPERREAGLQPARQAADNAHIEAFNGRFRQECLSQHWFLDLGDARGTVDAWREDYNNHRPHSALGQVPPAEFRAGGDFTQGRIGPLNSQA